MHKKPSRSPCFGTLVSHCYNFFRASINFDPNVTGRRRAERGNSYLQDERGSKRIGSLVVTLWNLQSFFLIFFISPPLLVGFTSFLFLWAPPIRPLITMTTGVIVA
jgi:hypothetical protein